METCQVGLLLLRAILMMLRVFLNLLFVIIIPFFFLSLNCRMAKKWKSRRRSILIPIGKASVIREGQDVTLITHSRMINVCKAVAKELAKKGIQVELIDLRTIKPLDIATVASSIKKTNHAVLVEEGHIFAGIAAEVGFQIMENCFDFLDAPLERVCQLETPMPYSKVLEQETLPNVKRILRAVEKCLDIQK